MTEEQSKEIASSLKFLENRLALDNFGGIYTIKSIDSTPVVDTIDFNVFVSMKAYRGHIQTENLTRVENFEFFKQNFFILGSMEIRVVNDYMEEGDISVQICVPRQWAGVNILFRTSNNFEFNPEPQIPLACDAERIGMMFKVNTLLKNTCTVMQAETIEAVCQINGLKYLSNRLQSILIADAI